MANFFPKTQPGAQLTARGALAFRYNTARNQLLWVVAFSAINLILQLVGADLYFLFSATAPLILVFLGMFFCGKYPAEVYGEVFSEDQFLDSSVLVVLVVVAFAIVGMYLLCWFMAKKQKVAWMIVALVLFSLDTVLMLGYYGISFEILFDALFHAWIIYHLIVGIRAAFQLKNLPPEEEFVVDPADPTQPPLDFSIDE